MHLVWQAHIACRQGWSLAHRTQSKSIRRHLHHFTRQEGLVERLACVCVHNRDSLNGTRANRASQGRGGDDDDDTVVVV